tara:strand:+ start:97 stop:246 length:150 start_codon:yes stop_codon:yes gene_type:complete
MIFKNIKSNILQFIEVWSLKLHSWAWHKQWKEEKPEDWVKGYKKWKKTK